MPTEPHRRSRFVRPLQVLATSVVLLLLSVGLCNAGHFNLEGSSSNLANVGLLAFFASVATFVVAILWLFIAAIAGRDQ